ncbi:MAG: 7TM-DISM domain-containing protein, partial [Bacteroidia bacterium]
MKLIRSILLLVLIGSAGSLMSQTDSLYVDSLENVLRTGPDSSRLHTLMELADHLKAARRRDSVSRQMGLSYARAAQILAFQGEEQADKEEALKLLEFYYRRNDQKDSVSYIQGLLNEFDYLEGYPLPLRSEYKKQFYPNRLGDYLQYWYDSTGTKEIGEVLAINQFTSRSPRNADFDKLEGAWWFRTKLISNAEVWEDHTFYTGGDQERWDSVAIFSLGPDSTWQKQYTGHSLPEEDWLVPNASNHFVLNIPAKSENLYYFRVRGTSSSVVPRRLDLSHINYHAFLQEEVKDRHVNGIFQGVVLIQLFFFLLLFLATKDHIYGYYVLYILGLGLFILTVNYSGLWFGLDKSSQLILYL